MQSEITSRYSFSVRPLLCVNPFAVACISGVLTANADIACFLWLGDYADLPVHEVTMFTSYNVYQSQR